MKNLNQKSKVVLFLVLAFLFLAITVKAQSPNAFSYQVVLRDASGNPRMNDNINIAINIVQGSADGALVYEETHNVTTNNQGLATLAIGTGNANDSSFSNIDWSNGPYFIKVSVDGVDFGSSQLLSVPYAMYASEAGSISNTGFKLQELPATSTGERNTAYGESALSSNTIGYYNSAFGYYSLRSNTTGNYNTVLGCQALEQNTTGGWNTALGAGSLRFNTEGWDKLLQESVHYIQIPQEVGIQPMELGHYF